MKCSEMVVKVIQGIPFVVDAATKKIFSYDKGAQGSICLGTYDPEKEKFALVEGWKELYQPLLEEYRQSVKIRSRLPASSESKSQTR